MHKLKVAWVGGLLVLMTSWLPGGSFAAERLAKPATGPATTPSDEAIPDRFRQLAASLERKLPEAKFQGEKLTEVMDYFRDVTQLNVLLDLHEMRAAKIDPGAPVELSLKDAKALDVLIAILQKAAADKLEILFDRDGVLLVTTKDRAKVLLERKLKGFAMLAELPKPPKEFSEPLHADKALLAQLGRKLTELNFSEEQNFEDAIAWLRDVSQIEVQLDWDSLKGAGIAKDTKVAMHLYNTPLIAAFRNVAIVAGEPVTAYLTKAGGIRFTTRKAMEKATDVAMVIPGL